MVSLKEFLRNKKESYEDFMNRSYWIMAVDYNKEPFVLVWKSKHDKELNMDAEIWSFERAKEYVMDLNGFDEEPELQSQEQATQIEPELQLVEISEEMIGCSKPVKVKWVNRQTGEVVHEFGEKDK